MKTKSQWLFETPPTSESDRHTTPYANPEWEWESQPVSYFKAPPNDREWEILWEFESSGGSTSEYPGASRFVPAAAGNYTKWYHSSPRPIRRIVIHITD